MSNEKMREEFEAWAKPHLIYGDDSEDVEGFDMRMECAYYIRTETQAAWEAWQASRAAFAIVLPEPYAVIGDYAACGGGRSVWDVEHAEKITDRMCEKTSVYDRAGLEAAGFEVKS